MTTVGAFEAKTHLPQLLERVARGETILITRHGKPAALLSPASVEPKRELSDVIREFQAFSRSRGCTLGGETAREWIDEGRRY